MKIQKRDGRVVPYEEEKIREAIHKANNEVEERYRASEGLIEEILEDVQQEGKQTQTVEHIQDMIEEHLVEHNKYTLAKKYIVYRYQRSLLRKSNTGGGKFQQEYPSGFHSERLYCGRSVP